jgi:hypothetical protein
MTWVRYDDNVRDHPKVRDLDDATYRLWREAIEWSSSSQTDGVIRRNDLLLTSRRASTARAAKLVTARLWHPAGETCGHPKCPPSGVDGWVIHDYWDYNPTAEAVRDEQAKARERKRRWMEGRKNGGKNGVPDAVPDGVRDEGKNDNPAPPRPAPKGRGEATPHQRPADTDHGSAVSAGTQRAEITYLAVVACSLCDGFGYRNGRVCDHDPSTPARARRGAALVRQAMTRQPTPEPEQT